MLHALTLLPLVAPAAPAPGDALLSVVPANALVCVHAPDPRALIASRARARGWGHGGLGIRKRSQR